MVRTTILASTLALVLTVALPAAADPCPANIQYQGGAFLKRDNNYYYRNGSFLLRDANLYYPTGAFLKRDANVYYANGSFLQRDGNLYYPNGAFLKRDGNYYYANGAVLKRDANFYYSNGAFARRDGRLYRPDGSVTAFPVQLRETIAGFGAIEAEVAATSDFVDVQFRDLLVNAEGVRLNALWNGQAFSRYEILLNTGVPGEDVLVAVHDGTVSCRLGGATPPPGATFFVQGTAGSARVTVRAGHDPVRVRAAVQAALDNARR